MIWKSLYNKKLKTELAGMDKEASEVLKAEEKKVLEKLVNHIVSEYRFLRPDLDQ